MLENESQLESAITSKKKDSLDLNRDAKDANPGNAALKDVEMEDLIETKKPERGDWFIPNAVQ